MPITVQEALSLSALKTAKVVAGKTGLNRWIHRVSVSECPEFETNAHKNWEEDTLFEPGDFFITSFYSIKDNEDQIMETIKLYNQYKSSGLCIIDLYLEKLPERVNQYANENSYPIIFISSKVAYAEIISEIMESIYQTREKNLYSQIIDDIRSTSSQQEIRRLSYSINKAFKESHRVLYITGDIFSDPLKQFIESINKTEENKAVAYKDGILALFTSNQYDTIELVNMMDSMKSEILPMIHIGVSQIHQHIYEINQSINEAIIASSFAEILNQNILQYEKLGIYRILYLLKETDELKELSNRFINKLSNYDKRNSTELLKTAEIYVENDGDLKKTSKCMFQHENTIRYRIGKIRSILEMENKNIEFHEQLSVAMKVKKMENIIVR